MLTIGVVGMGYVGTVTAAVLASRGHHVTAVERDPQRQNALAHGQMPFHEPGLPKLWKVGQRNRQLLLTTEMGWAAACDIVFVCVGTPAYPDGSVNLNELWVALRALAQAVDKRPSDRPHPLIVIRSTVPPGTAAIVQHEYFQDLPVVLSNPEFLREGAAVLDFLNPPLVVLGGCPQRRAILSAVYEPFVPAEKIVLTSTVTAEAIKYACNAWHATKVAFANEIGTLAGTLGASPREVMAAVAADSTAHPARYLAPAFAFGGSCLPKDLEALVVMAEQRGRDLPLLGSILGSNKSHLARVVRVIVGESGARHIGLVGLAFKAGTGDTRSSAALSLAQQLLALDREVMVFDSLVDSRQWYLPRAESLSALVGWADLLVLTQELPAQWALALHDSLRARPTVSILDACQLPLQVQPE